jgi:hypothetical protein
VAVTPQFKGAEFATPVEVTVDILDGSGSENLRDDDGKQVAGVLAIGLGNSNFGSRGGRNQDRF